MRLISKHKLHLSPLTPIIELDLWSKSPLIDVRMDLSCLERARSRLEVRISIDFLRIKV